MCARSSLIKSEVLNKTVFVNNCKSLSHIHNYEHEQAPKVTDLRRRPVMGFSTVALRPGESTDGQLGRDWAPPFCDRVSFRHVLGREYTQSPRSTPYSQ